MAGAKRNQDEQDALDFEPVMCDEIIQRNKSKPMPKDLGASEQIKLLESILDRLRSEHG